LSWGSKRVKYFTKIINNIPSLLKPIIISGIFSN
jgi:hypothetical protein